MQTSEKTNDLFESSDIIRFLIDLQKWSVQTDISVFKIFVFDIDKVIKSHKTEFESKVNEQIKKYPHNEQDIKEHFEEQYYQYYEMYPSLYRNSVLLTIYSYFEHNLNQICDTISKYGNSVEKYDKKNKRNLIERCKTFLTKTYGLDLSDIEEIWSNLTVYQKVRNAIAHNDSNTIKEKGKIVSEQYLFKTLKNNNNIKINDSGKFQIDNNQFLYDLCVHIEKYLSEVFKRIISKSHEIK